MTENVLHYMKIDELTFLIVQSSLRSYLGDLSNIVNMSSFGY